MRKLVIGKQKNNATTPEKAALQSLAEVAVETFNYEYKKLRQMQEDFEDQFPQAHLEVGYLQQQQDIVADSIATAKAKVARLGTTVGDFQCSNRYSKAKYDEAKLLSIITISKDKDFLFELVKGGMVKKLVLSDEATQLITREPTLSNKFNSAWRERAPLTNAVSVPKI